MSTNRQQAPLVLYYRSSPQRHPRRFLLLGALLTLGLPAPSRAQEVEPFFRQNCVSCHTIGGGRLTGPDLKGATERRSRAWLEKFVLNPQAVISAGDPTARQLLDEHRGVVMPTVAGITPEMVRALLNLVEAESKLPQSKFASAGLSDRPLTPQDLAVGRDIFLGYRRLAKDGPSCVSCHAVRTISGLGGGRLGPDLTRVYERLGGRKGAGTWLTAPATPTMQALYGKKPLEPEEILPLLALVEHAHEQGGEADATPQVNFFLLGFAGMFLGLIVLQLAWRERFRAVRRYLVHPREGSPALPARKGDE